MKITLDNGAHIPTRATEQAAGLDLYSPVDAMVIPWDTTFIDTGVHIRLQPDEYAEIKGRSGLARRGVMVATGTIDSDYRGALGIVLYNVTDTPYQIHKGDRVAQLVVQPVRKPEIEIVDELDDTGRGSGGFGSTGR